MNFSKVINKNIIGALYRAFFGVIFFAMAYFFYNLEITRANIGDSAFDTINKFSFSVTKSKIDPRFPNVVVYSIDDEYLKEKNLLTQHGDDTTYGYIMPRKYIAELIKNLDERVKEYALDDQPTALFLDISMSYTSLPENNELSEGDIILIDTLLADRNYPIILPKYSTNHFLEQLAEKADGKFAHKALKIKKLIEDQKIMFASVMFLYSQDNITRRYLPYEQYPPLTGETYYSFATIGWQLAKNGKFTQTEKDEIEKHFTKEIYTDPEKIKKGYDIVESNILYKQYTSHPDDHVITSNWVDAKNPLLSKHTIYSAHLLQENKGNVANAIVMIGMEHKFSSDKKFINFDLSKPELSGLQMHAQTLLTLFYLDGKLERYNIFYSMFIVFLVFFIIDLLINTILKNISFQLKFIITIIMVLTIFFLISLYLLQYQKQWFNWSIPIVFFWIEEFIEFFKRYFSKSTTSKEST